MERKDAARVLFMQGFSGADIAKSLKVSENTVSSWSRKGGWKDKKLSEELMNDNSVSRIIALIDYQTKALERKVQLWQDEDPLSTKLIERGDLDALQKLFSTIKKDSKKYVDYVSVLKEFFDFLHRIDLTLAKDLMQHGHVFLEEKRKLL